MPIAPGGIGQGETTPVDQCRLPYGYVVQPDAFTTVIYRGRFLETLCYHAWMKDNAMSDDPLTELWRSFVSLTSLPFPPPPGSNSGARTPAARVLTAELADVFTDLLIYDGFVAGCVTRALQGECVPRDDRLIHSSLVGRLEQVIATSPPQWMEPLRLYLERARILRALLDRTLIVDSDNG